MMNSWRNRSLALVGFFTAIRALIMGQTGLGDAEAYYWTWSRHLDWSYFDHPPVTAYLIRLFNEIGGNGVFVTRLPALLLIVASSYLLYRITYKLYQSERASFWALLVFNISPVFAVGTLQILPDSPVLFFWLLFIHLVVRVLEEEKPWLWYAIGAVVGLGLLSKYMAVLLPPSTLLLLSWHQAYRKHLKQPHIYLGGLLSLAIFLPVIYWNIYHKFSSFEFHLEERHDMAHTFDTHYALMALAGQLFYYSPIMWGITIYLAFNLGKRVLLLKEQSLKVAIPFWFGVPPLIFFMLITFWTTDSEPHWTSLAYLSLFIAWGWYYVEGSKRFQRLTQASLLLAGAVVAIFEVQMLVPVLPIENAKYDITNVLYGWDEAGEAVLEESEKLPGDNKFILTHHYLLAGQLAYAMQGRLHVYDVNKKIDAFDFYDDNIPPLGGNFIFVAESQFKKPPERYYRFDHCDEPRELKIYRGEKFARLFRIYKCYDYQGQK
jgi:hypothetical protein